MDPFIPLAPRHSLCVPSDQREVGLHHPLSFSPFFGDSNHQSIWEVNMTLRHMKHYCIWPVTGRIQAGFPSISWGSNSCSPLLCISRRQAFRDILKLLFSIPPSGHRPQWNHSGTTWSESWFYWADLRWLSADTRRHQLGVLHHDGNILGPWPTIPPGQPAIDFTRPVAGSAKLGGEDVWGGSCGQGPKEVIRSQLLRFDDSDDSIHSIIPKFWYFHSMSPCSIIISTQY